MGKIVKGIGNVFLGKKDPGTPGQYIGLDPSLQRVVDQARGQQEALTGLYAKDIADMAAMPTATALARRQQIERERQIRGGMEQAQRQVQRQIAQRGIGRTSLGLRAMLGAERAGQQAIEQSRAQMPLQVMQAQQARLGMLGAAGGGLAGILGAPGAQRAYQQARPSAGRRGGLLSIAAPIVGAALGSTKGPEGAAAGMQVGSGISSALQSAF